MGLKTSKKVLKGKLLHDTIARLTGKHGATVKENGSEAKGLGSLNCDPK